jgi:nickel/cobalt transporter (NicO) family protein
MLKRILAGWPMRAVAPSGNHAGDDKLTIEWKHAHPDGDEHAHAHDHDHDHPHDHGHPHGHDHIADHADGAPAAQHDETADPADPPSS